MAQDVTSGVELLNYKGDADLSGEGTSSIGSADSSFTPLQTWALYSWHTNKINYETQEKDRAALEEMYKDPTLYTQLDEDLANQLQPQLEGLSKLMKSKPYLYSNREAYYDFMGKYKGALTDMAKLKTVQTARDGYKKLLGAERNENKVNNYKQYISKLGNWKLGEEIPAYQNVFDIDSNHFVSGVLSVEKKTIQDGDFTKTVEITLADVLDLDKKEIKKAELDLNVPSSGSTLATGIFLHDNVDYYSEKMKEKASKSMEFNLSRLQNKYKDEFEKYKAINPSKTITDFLNATNRESEITALENSLSYLSGGLQYIDVNPNEPKLYGFTYSADGKKRLSIDDLTLMGAFSAMETNVGVKVKELDAKYSDVRSKIALNEEKVRTEKTRQTLNNARTNKTAQDIANDQIPTIDTFERNVNAYAGDILMNGNTVALPNYYKGSVERMYAMEGGKPVVVSPIQTPIYEVKNGNKTGTIIGYKDPYYKIEYKDSDGQTIPSAQAGKMYLKYVRDFQKEYPKLTPSFADFVNSRYGKELLKVEFVGKDNVRTTSATNKSAWEFLGKQYNKKGASAISYETEPSEPE